MPVQKTIRVFVASPGDVASEREILDRVIHELNDTLRSSQAKVELELVRHEMDVRPAAGRPQGSIFKQIGDYDVLIALMWRRLGTPTGKADSGTIEEYLRAYRSWKRSGKPEIMFYFSRAAAPPPTEVRDAWQLLKVVQFRNKIKDRQLIADYDGPAGFEAAVRRHLNDVIGAHDLKLKKPARGPKRRTVEAIEQAAFLQDLKREIRRIAKAQKPRKGNGRTQEDEAPLSRAHVAAVVKVMKLLGNLGNA
jgi:hypothetical protein